MSERRKFGWRRALLRSGTVLGLVAASNAAVLTPAAETSGGSGSSHSLRWDSMGLK